MRRSERQWSEAYLVQRLRDGHLLGDELVRPTKDDPWVPLHSTPLWSLAMGDQEPRAVILRRHVQPLLTHAVVFAGVMVTTGFPSWGLWWAIGLFAHASRVYNDAAAARAMGARRSSEPGLSTPLLDAIQALDASLTDVRDNDPLRDEVSALRDAATALEQRLTEIDGLLAASDLSELETERAKLSFESGKQRAIEALDERIRTALALADTRAQLDEERTALLHQVEALRLGLATVDRGARSGRGGRGAPDLTGRVRELRLRAAAEREVNSLRR